LVRAILQINPFLCGGKQIIIYLLPASRAAYDGFI
jgi:hypothetical protein